MVNVGASQTLGDGLTSKLLLVHLELFGLQRSHEHGMYSADKFHICFLLSGIVSGQLEQARHEVFNSFGCISIRHIIARLVFSSGCIFINMLLGGMPFTLRHLKGCRSSTLQYVIKYFP